MIRGEYPSEWKEIALACKQRADWTCIRCSHAHDIPAGYMLTVHHFNGDKSNCQWWNLLALCQRCHLSIQARVDPEITYFLQHSEWIKPYVAGFYASKYHHLELSREEVEAQLDLLLNLECRV
jgi:5-methylcytosine-specific restriction endonuclease McrA